MPLMKLLQAKNTDERGFTLVEVLASLVVLAIVGLAMTAFFFNAMSYAKGNQNKTVMVNLARNTLFYLQKEADFSAIKSFYQVDTQGIIRRTINSNDCPPAGAVCTYAQKYNNELIVSDTSILRTVLNPVINGITYKVSISYQEDLYTKLSTGNFTDNSSSTDIAAMKNYLIPVKVTIWEEIKASSGSSAAPSNREMTEVEGYITDESIR